MGCPRVGFVRGRPPRLTFVIRLVPVLFLFFFVRRVLACMCVCVYCGLVCGVFYSFRPSLVNISGLHSIVSVFGFRGAFFFVCRDGLVEGYASTSTSTKGGRVEEMFIILYCSYESTIAANNVAGIKTVAKNVIVGNRSSFVRSFDRDVGTQSSGSGGSSTVFEFGRRASVFVRTCVRAGFRTGRGRFRKTVKGRSLHVHKQKNVQSRSLTQRVKFNLV